MSDDRPVEFLDRGMRDARSTLAALRAWRECPNEMAKLAHRLVGTSRTLGLVAIGDHGTAIERAAVEGHVSDHLLDALAVAVDETERELGMSYGGLPSRLAS